tara:strand:- start:125 stop:343 length:219 start_codon:yes stop_codon:yes gene_type:complete
MIKEMDAQTQNIQNYINTFNGSCKQIVGNTYECIENGNGNSANCYQLLKEMQQCKIMRSEYNKNMKHYISSC